MARMGPIGGRPLRPRRPPRAILSILMFAGAAHAQGPSTSPAPAASPAATERPSPTDERLRRVRGRKQPTQRDGARWRGQERSLLADVERLELEVRLRSEQLRETQ